MLKRLLFPLFFAVFGLGIGVAHATVGQSPLPGIENTLPDGQWLNGLAGGQNYLALNGVSAAGTTQATATQLPAGYAMVEVDTVGSSAGVALQTCQQGVRLSLYNNGSNTLTVYPSISNNPLTGNQDTINNTTSVSVNSHTSEIFSCAKNGVWSAK